MKNMINKMNRKMTAKMCAVGTMVATALSSTAYAKGANLDGVADPIIALINSVLGPALGVVTALGTVYCVLLGVKFAKAEEQQDREKAKTHLKNAIIGFVLIFVLILALNLAKDPLMEWITANNVKVDLK